MAGYPEQGRSGEGLGIPYGRIEEEAESADTGPKRAD